MANPNKYTEFPVDGNNKPVMSSTKRHLLVITGNDDWQDLAVPVGVECKECLLVVHTMDESNYNNYDDEIEFHYRPDPLATSWVPLLSGCYGFAGKEGANLGQVRLKSPMKLTIMFMS